MDEQIPINGDEPMTKAEFVNWAKEIIKLKVQVKIVLVITSLTFVAVVINGFI